MCHGKTVIMARYLASTAIVLLGAGGCASLPATERQQLIDAWRQYQAGNIAGPASTLDRIIRDGSLQAKAVYGFFPANATGDDIALYADDSRAAELGRVHTLRQQWERKAQDAFHALADFVAPVESGRKDYLGAFAVTTGHGCDELCRKYDAEHDDYSSIMVKAIADRLAEACAEWLHAKVRREWGYGRAENLTTEQLIEEQYRGIRPAPGYPACPNLEDQAKLFTLLDPGRIGVELSQEFQLDPEQSTSAIIVHHPEAKYFNVS